jgi:starvation-inducible DNA-binding protein
MLRERRLDENGIQTNEEAADHDICQEFQDVATASLIEVWIDQAERRTWFLGETLHGRP